MTSAGIIERAAADGVIVALTAAGTIRATGDREAMKRWQATLREHRQDVIAALSSPDPIRRTATPSEAAELRKLVAQVLVDADETDREEALALALGDPEAALESFRLLAKEARDWALWALK